MRVHFLFLLIILLCLPMQGFAQQGGGFLDERPAKAIPDPIADQKRREQRTRDVLNDFSDGVVEGMKERGADAGEYFSDGDDYLDIPTEFIDEAMAYKAQCEADLEFSNYYNCECLAVKYLDLRVQNGADYDVRYIKLKLRGQCKDGTFLSAVSYNRCLGQGMRPETGQDPDKFCKCYSRIYARAYERIRGAVSSNAHLSLRTRSIVACREKGLELAPD